MSDTVSQRVEWIEPEVRELAITETANLPGMSHDGETIWTDCTLS